jgi:predicted RNA binding protein YcfA (HicA-like mRNA interferase family)
MMRREWTFGRHVIGFAVARQRDSHVVLRRGSNGCVVPNHREIKVGTMVGILKQTGVTLEELTRALRS